MLSDVTLIIKTFERPLHLNLLLESIKKFYPNIKTIVADDSRNPIRRDDVEYHILPYDVGLSAGRNYLVERVKTKFFVLLDDDFVFLPQTDILKLRNGMGDYDIYAGAVREGNEPLDYYGRFIRTGDTVEYVRSDGEVDFTPNFFIAQKGVRWDDYLKTTEHFDFFYSIKGKKRVGYTKDVVIDHRRESFGMKADYVEHRSRRKEYLDYTLKKHGLKKLIAFTEIVTL